MATITESITNLIGHMNTANESANLLNSKMKDVAASGERASEAMSKAAAVSNAMSAVAPGSQGFAGGSGGTAANSSNNSWMGFRQEQPDTYTPTQHANDAISTGNKVAMDGILSINNKTIAQYQATMDKATADMLPMKAKMAAAAAEVKRLEGLYAAGAGPMKYDEMNKLREIQTRIANQEFNKIQQYEKLFYGTKDQLDRLERANQVYQNAKNTIKSNDGKQNYITTEGQVHTLHLNIGGKQITTQTTQDPTAFIAELERASKVSV